MTAAAIDTPHRVEQKDQKTPEGNELETALGQLVVAGAGLMATRTSRFRAFARPDDNLDALVIGTEACLVINESRKAVTAI